MLFCSTAHVGACFTFLGGGSGRRCGGRSRWSDAGEEFIVSRSVAMVTLGGCVYGFDVVFIVFISNCLTSSLFSFYCGKVNSLLLLPSAPKFLSSPYRWFGGGVCIDLSFHFGTL